MKTHKLSLSLLAAGLLAMGVSGCSSEMDVPAAGTTVQPGLHTITADKGSVTRLSYADDGADGLTVRWTADDAFMLFRGAAYSRYTIHAGDAGKSSANFTNDGTSLADGTGDYCALYPASRAGATFDTSLLDLTGQVQVGDADTRHLNDYSYMTAVVSDGNWNDNLSFDHRIAVLKFNVTLPDGLAPRDLVFGTNDENGFRIAEHVDGSQAVTARLLSMRIVKNIDESGVETAYDSNRFTAYMAVLPATLGDGKALFAKVICTNGAVYTYEATIPANGWEYAPGRVYNVTLGGAGKALTASSSVYDDAIAAMTLSNFTSYTLEGEGDAASPYLIKTATDLRFLQAQVKENTQQGNWSTDYASTNPYVTAHYRLETDIQVKLDTEYWKPIGDYNRGNLYFQGTFDGNGHTFSGELKCAPDGGTALFYYIRNSTITNLHTSADILTGSDAAGIVYSCSNSTISHCSNSGKIVQSSGAAGICRGSYLDTISHCSNSGELQAASVAGICYSSGSTITHCTNNGNLLCSGLVGGICAVNMQGRIEYCYNNGAISSTGTNLYLGGIVATNEGMIENSINRGTLEGSGTHLKIGGIVGSNMRGGGGFGRIHTSRNESTSIEGHLTSSEGYLYIGTLVGYNPALLGDNPVKSYVYDCCSSVPVGSLGFIGYADDDTYTLAPCNPSEHTDHAAP